MDHKTKNYLAAKLAEKRAGQGPIRVIGLTDKVHVCDHCGKSDLAKTIEVSMPDGRVMHLGTDCAKAIREKRFKQLSETTTLPSPPHPPPTEEPNDLARKKTGSIEDVVTGFEFVPTIVRSELPDTTKRAMEAGAKPPLEFMGAGMTSIVFCDAQGIGWKVGRRESSRPTLREEAEWLFDASKVPYVKDHVAKIRAFHEGPIVIERECVQGQAGRWGMWGDNTYDVHEEIRKRMKPAGWTAPEYKQDSYVMTKDRGWVLVDASMPTRLGHKLVEKIEGLMDGSIEAEAYTDRPSDYRFHVRMEMQSGSIPADQGQAILDRLSGCEKFPCIEDESTDEGDESESEYEESEYESEDRDDE